jgi:hypothetical protein
MSIHKYRTRPTLTTVAGTFRSCQIKAFPKHFEQGRPMFNLEPMGFAIYL